MKVKILFTVKYNGKYYTPGEEVDMKKADAVRAIDRGAAEEVVSAKEKEKRTAENQKKQEEAKNRAEDVSKKGIAKDDSLAPELLEKATALGIDTEDKTEDEIKNAISEALGEGA